MRQRVAARRAWPPTDSVRWWRTLAGTREAHLRHVAAVGPAMAMSAMITLTVATGLLPRQISSVVLGGWAMVAWMSVTRAGERAALRVLRGARRLADPELTGLAPVIADLCGRGLGPPVVELCVGNDRGPLAKAYGRQSVVMTPTLLQAALTGQLPRDEVVAVLAHEGLTLRSGHSANDVAIAVWSLPWLAVRALGRRIARLLGPLWKLRAGVFSVAIWQTLLDSRPGSGSDRAPLTAAALLVVLVLTYWMPWGRTRWERFVCEAADVELMTLDLGVSMAAFLRRTPSTPPLARRIAVLDPPVPATILRPVTRSFNKDGGRQT
jgi:Zn-dependent protease with chaperone function